MTAVNATHTVKCPECRSRVSGSAWKYYVPAHVAPGATSQCPGSDRGSKPNHGSGGKTQLCFKCGKYCRRSARFCPNCDK